MSLYKLSTFHRKARSLASQNKVIYLPSLLATNRPGINTRNAGVASQKNNLLYGRSLECHWKEQVFIMSSRSRVAGSRLGQVMCPVVPDCLLHTLEAGTVTFQPELQSPSGTAHHSPLSMSTFSTQTNQQNVMEVHMQRGNRHIKLKHASLEKENVL
jgi:hypothetical protein